MATENRHAAEFDPALSFARQALYRFASLSLLDPKAGVWGALDLLSHDSLLIDAATLIRNAPKAKTTKLGVGERPLGDLDPAKVLRRLPDSPQTLNVAFENTFGLLVSSACPPYETEYIGGKSAFQRSHALADISGFYRAFGLTMSAQVPERHDHVVLELEFMAFLVGLERQASREGRNRKGGRDAASPTDGGERMRICQHAQRRFLKEHLSWWLPALGRLLARENQGGFYEAVGIFLAALIPAERGLLDVPVPAREATPSRREAPETCDGCEVTN